MRHAPCVVERAWSELQAGDEWAHRRLYNRMQIVARRLDPAIDTAVWHVEELGRSEAEHDYARSFLHGIEEQCAKET